MEHSLNIEYYNTYADIEKSINIISSRSSFLIGFDTESTSPEQIDVIQLATSATQSYVYQISNCVAQYKLNFSNTNLGKLLMSKEIVKTGVDINCDMDKLYKTFGNNIKLNSFLDSQAIAITKGIVQRSMNDLGKLLIKNYNCKISKGGNYNNVPLTASQIEYAAKDAVYSYQIYLGLMGHHIPHVECRVDNNVIINSIIQYLNSNNNMVKKDSLIKYLSNSVSEIKKKIPVHERKVTSEDYVYQLINNHILILRGAWIILNNITFSNNLQNC